MPELRNHRQERFCWLVASGVPPLRAYPEAGYNPHPGSPYRLRDNARVKARMAEISIEIKKASELTPEDITQMLMAEATPGARADSTSASRTQALKTLAQSLGMLTMNTADKTPNKDLESLVAKLESSLGELGPFAGQKLRQDLGLPPAKQEAGKEKSQ